MLSELESITADDPRIVHRTRHNRSLVLLSDKLFYVFSPPLFKPFTGQYRWTFGFKSKFAAVSEARRLARLPRHQEAS